MEAPWTDGIEPENRWEGEITRAEFVDSENPILRLYVQRKVVISGCCGCPWTTSESSVFIKSKSDNETLTKKFKTTLERLSWVKQNA